MPKKILFGITQIILGLIISISGCKDNPVNNGNTSLDFCVTDFEPAWSPDGNTIAYVHGDTITGQTGIWLIDINNNNKRIIYASISAYSPTWSPDGQWIAFSDQAQIFKMKLDGDSLTQLTVTGRNFFPAWSPDGQWIAYNKSICEGPRTCGIWLSTSNNLQQIFIDDFGNYPNWNPTGYEIIYPVRAIINTGPGDRDVIILGDSIFIYNINTQSRRCLIFMNGVNYSNSYFKYSRDSKKIAFTSQPNGGKSQIWIMNSDGSNLYQLTSTQGYSCDWSPNGEWIVYTDSRGVSGKLWLIRSDGGVNHQLTF